MLYEYFTHICYEYDTCPVCSCFYPVTSFASMPLPAPAFHFFSLVPVLTTVVSHSRVPCVGISALCTTKLKTKQWAADLEKLCLETADERTCLEATAYSAWMSGNLLLEREAWREALDRYSTAHRICQELGKVRLTAFVDVDTVGVV